MNPKHYDDNKGNAKNEFNRQNNSQNIKNKFKYLNKHTSAIPNIPFGNPKQIPILLFTD